MNVAMSGPGGGRFDRKGIEIPVAHAVLRHEGLRKLCDRLRKVAQYHLGITDQDPMIPAF